MEKIPLRQQAFIARIATLSQQKARQGRKGTGDTMSKLKST